MARFNGLKNFTNIFTGGADNDEIFGGNMSDVLHGGAGNDTLLGGTGNDIIHGGADNDLIKGGDGNDKMFGDGGVDTFIDFVGSNQFNGGDGFDTVDYSGEEIGERLSVLYGADGVATLTTERMIAVANQPGHFRFEGVERSIASSIEKLIGTRRDDEIFGAAGNQTFFGGQGNDLLFGGSGVDTLSGDQGNDTLRGGRDADTLTGGAGRDIFGFADHDADTRVTLADGSVIVDKITDFNVNDRDMIDLQFIDANTLLGGDQPFSLVDNFSGEAGELLLRQDGDTTFRLIGDTNGDGVGDMFIDFSSVRTGLTTDFFADAASATPNSTTLIAL